MPEKVASTFNVPVDKLLEDAEDTGALLLSGRKMTIFPPTATAYDMSDVIEVGKIPPRMPPWPSLSCSCTWPRAKTKKENT